VVDEEVRQAIVMEDDADVDLSIHMRDVAAFVADAPPDWEMLYLGINNDKVHTHFLNPPQLLCCSHAKG